MAQEFPHAYPCDHFYVVLSSRSVSVSAVLIQSAAVKTRLEPRGIAGQRVDTSLRCDNS